MNGKEIRDAIYQLHHRAPEVLAGARAPEDFLGELDTCFQRLEEAASTLAAVLPADEAFHRILAGLREVLRGELDLNRILLPALESREPQDNVAYHAASIFAIMSGDLMDRLFSRLMVLAEILGLLDGSIDFPDETYYVYRQLRGVAQRIVIGPIEDLDA